MSVTSLIGLGVSRKSRDLHRHPPGSNDEQWHIPYNGPYEQRPGTQKPRNRDSWGDPVDGYSDEDMQEPQPVMAKQQLQPIDTKPSTLRQRRARSGYPSGLITSSGTNPTVRDSVRPPFPSYINLNSDGGVGQSPMPPTLTPRDSAGTPSRRKSFINIFARTSSNTGRNRKSALVQEDYYNSYYSTLEPNPVADTDQYNPVESPPVSSSGHPYANPYAHSPATPKSAPLPATKSPRSPRHPHVTLHPPVPSTSRNIRNSSSSPDLRNVNRSQALRTLNSPSPSPRPNVLKKRSFPARAREKWLSAETWCDAILFPRPRFRVQQSSPLSPRVVSPPGTPLAHDFISQPHRQDLSIQSRVLAHSRSLVDLNASKKPKAEDPFARQHPLPQVLPQGSSTALHPPRPKSWALDDLALPSPVPSLARYVLVVYYAIKTYMLPSVLEEGQILEHQRKKWQTQAASSFQNKRTRSASRARAKSNSGNMYPEKEKPSPIAFLAARSLVGNQDTPKINITPSPSKSQRARSASHAASSSQSRKSHTGTSSMSRSGHAPSNSMSTSKSHAKSDSFGRRVASAVCGTDDNIAATPDEEASSPVWTNAVGGDTVRLTSASPLYLRDTNQGLNIAHMPTTEDRVVLSPVPSERIGIALSTPPPGQHFDDSNELRMPSHPYAQGGTYTLSAPNQPVSSEYAGPHLVVRPNYPTIGDESGAESNARYLLHPPTHPYAQARSSQRDSVPAESTMWAQLSTDGLHEIRPNDIQYSPFTSSPASGTPIGRNSEVIIDTFGVAETLANAVRDDGTFRDSGIGSSETAESGKAAAGVYNHPYATQEHTLDRHHDHFIDDREPPMGREPIRYDPVNSRPAWESQLSPPRPILTDTRASSSGNTSSSSSAGLSPPINSDDLDVFQDLFYRPHPSSPPRPSLARSNSGLTALARKLSREMEELNMERQTVSSSIFTAPGSSVSSQRRRDKGLQFVITADDRMEVLERNEGTSVMGLERPSIGGFPEDVNSRASTPGMFLLPANPINCSLFVIELVEPRLRTVSEQSTPPPTTTESRRSFSGLLSYLSAPEMDAEKLSIAERDIQRLTASSLAPPSSNHSNSRNSSESQGTHSVEHARRSYMSGMSLSEFPDPPSASKLTPAHMSVLNSYFDQGSTPLTENPPASPVRPKFMPRRSTFGSGDSTAEAILDDLREEDETRTASETAH